MSDATTRRVKSDRGDTIAYSDTGRGELTVLLVDGAFGHRGLGPLGSVREVLERDHRVIHPDRRGRGESHPGAPDDLERELRDLDALLDEVGPAVLLGTSSGAALALRVAARRDDVRGVIAFEPPFSLDGTHTPSPPDFRERIAAMLARGERDRAASLFLRAVGVPWIGVKMMRLIPKVWRPLRAHAHTLPADFAALGETQSGGPLPEEWRALLGEIRAPALLLAGAKSPHYLQHAARVVAEAIPGATHTIVPGADHTAGGELLASAARPLLDAIAREH